MKAHYLKLNQLRFIAALKRKGKLHLAASDLHISQPAASRMLSDIEALVGRQICTRNAHGLVFNEFGDVLAARASRVVAEVENIGRDMREVADGLRGRVRIGAVTAGAIAYVLPASVALRAQAPHAQLQVDVEPSLTLMQRMRAGEYDFVLARLSASDDPSAYDVRPIGEETLSFVVRQNHPLAGRPTLRFHDLSPYDWILQPAGSPIWSTVVEAFRREGADFPERVTHSASALLTLATISRTDAIAPLAQEVAGLLMSEDLGTRIVTLDVSGRASVPAYHLILPRNALLSPLADRFLSLIVGEIGAGAL